MNGNVTTEFHWLPPCGIHTVVSEAQGERRLPLDRSHISPAREDPLAFFLGTGAEWGLAGYAAAVGLHPRVWRLGLYW